MTKPKRGRPTTVNGNYQKWSDREKVCRVCGESKKIGEFPGGSGTYKKSDVCNSCTTPKESGEIIGNAYIARGKRKKRLSADHQIFKPTRIREQDLDLLAQHVLNNEGQIIDFEE